MDISWFRGKTGVWGWYNRIILFWEIFGEVALMASDWSPTEAEWQKAGVSGVVHGPRVPPMYIDSPVVESSSNPVSWDELRTAVAEFLGVHRGVADQFLRGQRTYADWRERLPQDLADIGAAGWRRAEVGAK